MTGCTNGEKIMDALDLLDEDMALEVAKLREGKKKRRPVLWRYGAVAACFALVLLGVLQLGPLMDRNMEGDLAAPPEQESAGETVAQDSSAAEDSMGALASCPENIPETDVSCGDEPGEEVSDGKNGESESLGGGAEGVPGDEPLPSLELKIEWYDGDTVVCTVVGNEGCTFYPVGSVVVLRFDFWEGEPITEASFTRGCVYSVLFNVGYEGDDENMLYAVDAYQLEE